MARAVKCVSDCCELVFRSHDEMHQHFADEWEDNKSHDYCKPCRYMARTWDELTDHKANSVKFHLCCKFCGEEFKALKTRENHIKKLHPVEQDLRCIGCQEHFVRGYALVGHLEFDNCTKIKAAQFKAAVEHKALINKMLDDPDYVRQNEKDIVSNASATGASTYADTDFDDSSTVGGVPMTAAESSHILDNEDVLSVADSQEGGVPIQPLVPTVTSPQAQNVQNVQRPAEQFPALPSRGSTPTSRTPNSAVPTPLRRGEGFPALPGRENISPTPSTPKASVATPLRRVEDFPALPGAKKGPMSPPSRTTSQLSMASSTATVKSPWKSNSDAWETSSQVSEVLFRGTGNAPTAETTAQKLFKAAVNTPLNEAWRQALAERDLEYDDRLRCNPFLLRFWDPEHPEYDPERFFHNAIGKYICPLKKCEAHFFEPSKMTEHLQGKHIITQVRCPTCLKLFNSCSSLLAHCENPGSECNVASTKEFYKVVDLYSGGFLNAFDARRDDITAEDMMDRIGNDNKIIAGSGMKDDYVKYVATVPHDWAGAGSDTAKKGITIGQSWGECSSAMRRNHGTMNPSVPISNSRRPARTTASIYPELVYNNEEDTPDTGESSNTGGTSNGKAKGKGRNKFKPANHLVNQNARRDPTGIYVAPEPIRQMTRAEMRYTWEADEADNKKEGEKKKE